MNTICSVDGCGRVRHAKGFCSRCYAAWRRSIVVEIVDHNTTGYSLGCRCEICKAAVAAYHRERYRDDPSKYKKHNDAWRAKNPDAVRAINRRSKKRSYDANPQKYIDAATSWGRANPERRQEIRQRYKYNITNAQRLAILESQGNKCGNPGCGVTEPGGSGTWNIDHDHSCCPGPRSCGKCIRGLLCFNCNIAEGHLRGDLKAIEGLAEYLRRGPISL